MAQALLQKGGQGSGSDDCTAVAANVLINTTAIVNNGTDEPTNGTMPNNGAQTEALDCGESVTISLGYHNGNGTITANSLASQTGVDSGKSAITADTVLEGHEGWVNGEKIDGTMINNGAVTPVGLNCGNTYVIPIGYHDGSGVVTANSLSSQTGVDSGKTAVTSSSMLSGYQGWVNGVKITGDITIYTDQGNTSLTSNGASKSYPAGYYPYAHGAVASLSYANW